MSTPLISWGDWYVEMYDFLDEPLQSVTYCVIGVWVLRFFDECMVESGR